MKSARDFSIVLVTAPDLKTARALAKARLIACANLLPKIASHYWWQGKIESGNVLVQRVFNAEVAEVFAEGRRKIPPRPLRCPSRPLRLRKNSDQVQNR